MVLVVYSEMSMGNNGNWIDNDPNDLRRSKVRRESPLFDPDRVGETGKRLSSWTRCSHSGTSSKGERTAEPELEPIQGIKRQKRKGIRITAATAAESAVACFLLSQRDGDGVCRDALKHHPAKGNAKVQKSNQPNNAQPHRQSSNP
ncbi:hypothetical protein DPEC_G00207970 [Dallia pectoralis]|uniref:Uncharacterized protein n=1 Tax=Dallia pectoralis TaxID=75939 RepID=A0ACC2G590_DALPE|nr:hypothetical protein DPEC_G00207970 [Dallia pectoralis]